MSEDNNSADFFNSAGGNKEGNKNNKMKWFYTALLIFILWLMFGGGNKTENKEETNTNQAVETTKEAENKTEEKAVTEQSPVVGSKDLQIAQSYVPVKDIYTNRTSYDANTFRLALKGEFKDVSLKIKAKTANDLKNFLSVNVGTFSGVYLKDTIFDKENPLEVSLDLKNSEKFTKSDNVFLWDYVTPKPTKNDATIVRLYATVFDEKGIYADNSEVVEFKLNYTCSDDDSECKAVICNDNAKSGGSCLIENFGVEATKNYIDYFTR
jgi:hypothetical protein